MTIPTTNATRAEEGDVLRAGRRHGPAEAILVETAGAHEVPRTESHQTDPRVHESLDNNWLAIRCRLVGKCGLLACYTPLPVRHRRHPAVSSQPTRVELSHPCASRPLRISFPLSSKARIVASAPSTSTRGC